MADIVFLALIALFIALRVRNTMGKQEGNEGDFLEKIRRFAEKPKIDMPTSKPDARIIDVEFTEEKDLGFFDLSPENASICMQIKDYSPSFSVDKFLSGANKAFEVILDAFSKKDKKTLQNLLGENVYHSFCVEIDKHGLKEEIQHITLVSVLSKKIKKIAVKEKYASITVEFVSEQILLTKNKEGKVISGDPSRIEKIQDTWVFSRILDASSPNWMLVAAETD